MIPGWVGLDLGGESQGRKKLAEKLLGGLSHVGAWLDLIGRFSLLHHT